MRGDPLLFLPAVIGAGLLLVLFTVLGGLITALTARGKKGRGETRKELTDVLGVLAGVLYLMGVGAVTVWRYDRRGVLRYAPAVATLTYSALALSLAYPPAGGGAACPPEDAARNLASALAFGSSLFLITRAPRKEQRQEAG